MEQGGKVYYYQKDGLGSVVALTDEAGQVMQRYEYDSFGKIVAQTGSIPNPFTYAGREYDEETTLYYYRARYYDARIGRFLTKDPIGFLGGDVNLYRYVRNNPVNYRDPDGLFWAPWHGGITFVAGLVEGRGMAESYAMAKESWHRDDNTQGPMSKDTNVHAMAGWDPELARMQKPHEAIREAMQIAADESACGRHGSAMHTLQDLSAFWHAGQKFTTLNPLEDPKMLVHYILDVLPPPSSVVEAFKISIQYLQQQRGR